MDRFDLEEKITRMNLMCDDLESFAEYLLDNEMSQYEISKALSGLAVINKVRHQELWDTFLGVFDLSE